MTGRARTTETGRKARELLESLTGDPKQPKTEKTAEPKPKPKPKPRAKQPPARVEPGWLHEAIAIAILKGVRDSASDSIGRPLNVGDLPTAEDMVDEATDGGVGEDGREPVELLARVIAHVFHRIPGISKIEKRLEGKEARSGMASDMAALLAQLYQRNKHLGPLVVDRVKTQYKLSQMKAQAKKDLETLKGGGQDVTQAGAPTLRDASIDRREVRE